MNVSAIRWHLQHRFCPPIPLSFLPLAVQAVELAQRGEWDSPVILPNGGQATARQVVRALRLEDMLHEVAGRE